METIDRHLKLIVGVTSHAYVLENEGPFTRGSRPGRTVSESVGGVFEMGTSDLSNGIRYHMTKCVKVLRAEAKA